MEEGAGHTDAFVQEKAPDRSNQDSVEGSVPGDRRTKHRSLRSGMYRIGQPWGCTGACPPGEPKGLELSLGGR